MPVGERRHGASAPRVVIALAILAVVAAACSKNASATTGGGGSGGGGGPTSFVVYSAQGYDSAMVKAFQQATGIPTKLVDDSTGPLLARVQAEKNNPQWAVLWVDGSTAFANLDQQGLLHKGYEPSVPFNAAGQSLIPSDKSYVPTGVTTMAAVVYDSTVVKDPPTSWQQLLSKQWENAVGMNDPSVSGPTYPFVAGMFQQMGGQSAGEKYFENLKNNGMLVFQTNGDTLHALETGQIKLGVVQSSAAIGAALQSKNLKYVLLPVQTMLPSCIGISAAAKGKILTDAEKFAAYVLSPAGQHVMQSGDPQGDSLYWPVVDGVNPLPALPSYASLQTQTIDPYTWGPKEGAVNAWFDANVKP